MIKRFLITVVNLVIFLFLIGESHSSAIANHEFNVYSKSYITDENRSFLEGQSGLKLYRGLNLFFIEEVNFSRGKDLSLNIELLQSYNDDIAKNEFYRGYLKYRIHKFSIEVGKDNINLGPGEYGLLLSNNVKPYPLILLQTEEPLSFIGQWNAIFIRGWLLEDRLDVSNPEIFALRFTWSPIALLGLGVTRTELFGGDGRPGYDIKDYPTLLFGTKDNVPGKFDNDGYGAYDITLNLPADKVLSSVNEAKLYFEDAGTDIQASWQDEDKGKLKFPGFKLLNHAVKIGVSISHIKNIFVLEYASTSDDFYIHHKYPVEGYTYNGLSLGYPYGHNMRSIFLKHKHFLGDSSAIEYKLGGYEQPFNNSTEESMRRYYLSFLGSTKIGNYLLEGFTKLEKTDNYNINSLPLPSQTSQLETDDKTFYTIGITVGYKF